MAEQLAREQLPAERRAVHRHDRAGPAAGLVDTPRKQLLACPRRARQQNRYEGGGGHFGHPLRERTSRRETVGDL
jgi:hypothetical protein